jgi:hypothetical protein
MFYDSSSKILLVHDGSTSFFQCSEKYILFFRALENPLLSSGLKWIIGVHLPMQLL